MRTAALFVAGIAVCANAAAQGAYDLLAEPLSMRLDEVIGLEVRTPAGMRLGTIRDVLVDPATGRVEFVALEPDGAAHPVGGLLGADRPGQVLLDVADLGSSAGATALREAPGSALLPGRTLGAPGSVTVDLLERRLRR